jgi:threonine/homoserine/homoserine lactone efflux protein
MIISFKKDKISISSKRKLFIAGIIIAILNPIFSGLVMSFVFITEPKLKKEGKILLLISFVWAIVLAFLMDWLEGKGYL